MRRQFRCCLNSKKKGVLGIVNSSTANFRRCGAAAPLRWCTGPVTTRNGLRPTAAYGSRCVHTPGVWRSTRWCATAHTFGPGRWGWACACQPGGGAKAMKGQPKGAPKWARYCTRNSSCMKNKSRVQLKRNVFATKLYVAQITGSRRANNRCIYSIRFPDGDKETNVQAVASNPSPSCNTRSASECRATTEEEASGTAPVSRK